MKSTNIKILIILLLPLCALNIAAQSVNDPVLFTVGAAEVGLSEFDYIYSKTNGKNANYTAESIEEYLDLYIKFKLKVQEAKYIQLDTVPRLQRELETYRRQLADSYLIDKEVTEKLAREAYDRMQKDISVRHILVAVAEDADDDNVNAAYKKAMSIKAELEEGAPFPKLAVKYTDHKPSRLKGGNLGYMTAILPEGFYELERAVYSSEVNQISDPVRSKMGYHILRVEDVRPARGKIDLAHILIRDKSERNDTQEKSMIDEIYKQLMDGGDFNSLAKQKSEDKESAAKQGYIGTYAIGLLEPDFEDVAFAIQNDGDYSEPFKSSVGWHILKRISKKGGEPYQDLKEQILNSLEQTERQEIAKQSLIEKIKIEGEYDLNEEVLQQFIDAQTKQFFTYKWKPKGINGKGVLFQLKGDMAQTINDFEAFISRAARARMRMGESTDIDKGVQEIYDLFVEEVCIKHEEKNLLIKYPDFRNLMREYEEGILLFEVTDQEIWSKASKDSIGLKEFFKTVDGKYRWEEKAILNQYAIRSSDQKLINKIRKYASRKASDRLLKKFNKKGEVVSVEQKEFEKGRNKVLDALTWKPKQLSGVEINPKDESRNFFVIEQIIPSRSKTLAEARGYVIADYQDYLEKLWIEALREKYPVKLNKEVLATLTKS